MSALSKLMTAVVNGDSAFAPDENVPMAIPELSGSLVENEPLEFPPLNSTFPFGVTPIPKLMSKDKKVDGLSKVSVIVVSPGPCSAWLIAPQFTGAPYVSFDVSLNVKVTPSA
jgi:hypothetical protein